MSSFENCITCLKSLSDFLLSSSSQLVLKRKQQNTLSVLCTIMFPTPAAKWWLSVVKSYTYPL